MDLVPATARTLCSVWSLFFTWIICPACAPCTRGV
jgi:hypothetical protein